MIGEHREEEDDERQDEEEKAAEQMELLTFAAKRDQAGSSKVSLSPQDL